MMVIDLDLFLFEIDFFFFFKGKVLSKSQFMLFGFRPLRKISLWLFTTSRGSGFSHFPTCNNFGRYSISKDWCAYYEKREKFVPKIKVKIIIDLDGARSGPNGLEKCLALEDEDEMDEHGQCHWKI